MPTQLEIAHAKLANGRHLNAADYIILADEDQRQGRKVAKIQVVDATARLTYQVLVLLFAMLVMAGVLYAVLAH